LFPGQVQGQVLQVVLPGTNDPDTVVNTHLSFLSAPFVSLRNMHDYRFTVGKP
jgi:hypothetical protein